VMVAIGFSCRISGDMPRNPAASQIGTPRCVSQVVAV
jgi:hypothetical protein